MSEEEYEQYLFWVSRRQKDLKADQIVAGPALVPTLISLAVGILFTAVGYLLTPKPKPLSNDERQIRNKQGDSEKGRNRFSPTYGFDSSSELATYGTPVPIHFGNDKERQARKSVQSNWPITLEALLCNDCTRYAPSPNESGGMLIAPSLVWSRMYSMGKGQLFQGMYVVGEKMDNGRKFDPDLDGIWIGNNTLDKLSDRNFAFYYDNEGKEGRIRQKDLREGTEGDPSSGNPFLSKRIEGYRTWAEAFPTPVCDMDESSGFSMTYSLSNQSTFGCYSPIMNGVDRRAPWRVISLPNAQDGSAEDQVKLERKKVSGGEDRMEPSGRGYGRLMGLTEYNGKALRGSKDRPRWDEEVQRGDTVRFEIMKKKYDEDLYEKGKGDDKVTVSVEDLINESDSDRQSADDALQIGEEFMINSSRFRVIDRDDGIYEMEEESTWAELECIEDRDAKSQIGFVSKDYFEEDICSDDASTSIFDKQHVPPHWSPLLKYELASFRNIRKADVTEIGIKSRVWAQMNGMCNFPTIPTSNELRDNYDKKDVQYTNGVQSQYFTRFSFFRLFMRDPEKGDPSNVSTWGGSSVIFAIRGNEPVDQYNYIRIKPEKQSQYEYRLYPLNSAWATKRKQDPDDWGTDDVAWVLDVAKGNEFSLVRTIGGVGKVEISGVGRLIGVRCAVTSPLMLGKKTDDDTYKEKDKGWCPEDWCKGFTGSIDIKLDDDDEPTEGLDKKLRDTCDGDTCFDPEEDGPSRGARQAAFWNRLAAREDTEDDVPDYIKDGFDIGCVECSSSWDDEPEVSVMAKDCETDYEEKDGRGGSNPTIESGIVQQRTARGPGASARVTEKWLWKGKTIWSGSTSSNVGRPWKDERKDSGKVYKPGKSKISNGGGTSGFFTWEIERCEEKSSGGGGGGGGGGDDDKNDNGCSKPYWGIWEYATQVNEGSYYAGLISRSCDSGAEHQIVYVNESKKPREIALYPELAMMGLSLRANREFNSLDQPRLFLRGGLAVKKLEDQNPDADFVLKAGKVKKADSKSAAVTVAAATPRRQQAEEIKVTMSQEIKCASNDRRLLKVTAGFKNQRGDKGIDPNYAAAKETRWNVQWFQGKNRDHSKRVKNPEWYNTTVLKDWTNRNPHTTIIQGNVAKILVPKDSGNWTCYMWPAESNTTNNSEIDDESGLDYGREQNTDLVNSLSMFLFNNDDEIKEVVTNGIAEITAQRTTGTKYEATYTYLWSGKDNYSTKREENGDYVYWYEVDSAREELKVETGDICPGDTKPPGPDLPGGDDPVQPNPGPAFEATIQCGDGYTTSRLRCLTKNCDSKVKYEWQWLDSDNALAQWTTPPGPVFIDNRDFYPGVRGYYRCKATCGSKTIKAGRCYVKSSFDDPSDPGLPDPDPPSPIKPPPNDDNEPIDADPSNNYADLIYWLLKDKAAGVGNVVSKDMVDKDRMIVTSKFIKRMGLTWDGTLSETTNLRSFASTTAPFFLCNFTVTNGKFTLWPVIPVSKDGVYKNRKVLIKQIFTEGNIIDGSFSLDYLDADDRRPFKASMRYRVMARNQLPEERTLTSRWYTGKFSDPTEEFDMTQFCTTPEHAQLAARYFLWIRNVVTHSVKLQTVPEVMNSVGPGDFIKVRLENATIQRRNIAAVVNVTQLNSPEPWEDGEYEVDYWIAGMDEPSTKWVRVTNNQLVNETGLDNAMISPRRRLNDDCEPVDTVYQVETVSLEDDGLVEVVASYYPVDENGVADLYNALFGLGRYAGLCGTGEEDSPS